METNSIWVTGSNGLIGGYLKTMRPPILHGKSIYFLTRRELDLTNFSAVEKFFHASRPDLIIHPAALSKSTECQKNPDLAWQTNFHATRHLAELGENVRLLFFSTDLVFDGKRGNYLEGDRPNPLSVYGETKVAAEEYVLRNPKHLVIRTSLNGGRSNSGDRGFNEEMRNAWIAGKTMKLFTDEFRCPIAARETARAIWELALHPAATGCFHVAGTEKLSRFDIGNLLRERWPGLNATIEPSSLRDYEGPPRAADVSLNTGNAQHLLSFKLPAFSQWLRENPEEPF